MKTPTQRPPCIRCVFGVAIVLAATHPAHALDLDGDGMSDVWQRTHNIATGDTATDIDGDGHSNAKEAEAGTDPRDPADYFRTFDFSVSPASDAVTLTWRSVEQRFYEVEQSTDLVTWSVSGDTTGHSGLLTTATLSIGSPINDLFANRWPASTSTSQTTGLNVGATSEPDEPINPSVAGSKTVWWSWSSSTSGEVTITTVGSDYDTTLAVYSGSELSNLVLLGSNDDTSGLQSSVTFAAEAGVPYSIQVDGYSGATGTIVLNHPISSGVLPLPDITSIGSSRIFFRVRGYPEYDSDSDGDSLLDWEEQLLGTDIYASDSDNDEMADGFEFIYQFDPLSAADAALDADNDLLTNAEEAHFGLNPILADSNGNGISDGDEDQDLDGLSNFAELRTYGTDPKQPDTDLDGLFDGWEIANAFSPTINNLTDADPTNDPEADPDGDGLTNSLEADYETKAKDPDSDGDGVDDADEINQGSNPNDPNDSSPPPNGTIPFNITFGDHSGSHSEKYQIRMEPQEGDTQVRQRTNRAYGQVQTDTIRLPKGAKYKVTIRHVSTDPDYDSQPKPDYDYTLEVDTSNNCLVLEDSDGISGVHNESGSFFAEGKDATLRVPLFEWITPKASPVSAPDDTGDGQNEFTYSAAAPGVLTIDLKVLVKPTGTAGVTGHDGVKFSDRCIHALPTIAGSTFAWDAANPGGKSTASGEHLIAKATYTTLPALNSEFGLKQAEFKCDGHTDTLPNAEFEVFFAKDEKNHPGVGAGTTPNWYFYWAGTAVAGYDLNSGTYSYAAGAAGDYAQYNGNPANPHYTIHGPASAGHEKYSSAGLNVDRKGIDTLACTLVHEKTHRQVDQNWLPGGIWHGKADSDGDELPDDWEDANAAIGYDKNNRFSFAGFPYGDDEEVYCEYAALGTTGDATKDWSNPGKQSKNKF